MGLWDYVDPLKIVLPPILGGVGVASVSRLVGGLDASKEDTSSPVRAALRPVARALAAAITLGSGNSLGPEGPSVEIGRSVAGGFKNILRVERGKAQAIFQAKALLAAGSAAGVAAGFNATISGVFFAIETVLTKSSTPLDLDGAEGEELDANVTIVMVLLAAVTAAAVVQAGLGAEPAFKVPFYRLATTYELPLYAGLGLACGSVAVVFNSACEYSAKTWRRLEKMGLPRWTFPAIAGLLTGSIALMYPEVTYQGFQNVNAVMNVSTGGQTKAEAEAAARLVQEQNSFVRDLFDLVPKKEAAYTPFAYDPPLLMQIALAKVFTTAVSKESGLVGGVFAPSILMGASLGMAYAAVVSGIILPIIHQGDGGILGTFTILVPQSYGLVGLAAMLGGICRVPLTAILLLFELTRNYAAILPTCAAVGVSYFVTISADRMRSQQLQEQQQREEEAERLRAASAATAATASRAGGVDDESLASTEQENSSQPQQKQEGTSVGVVSLPAAAASLRSWSAVLGSVFDEESSLVSSMSSGVILSDLVRENTWTGMRKNAVLVAADDEGLESVLRRVRDAGAETVVVIESGAIMEGMEKTASADGSTENSNVNDSDRKMMIVPSMIVGVLSVRDLKLAARVAATTIRNVESETNRDSPEQQQQQ